MKGYEMLVRFQDALDQEIEERRRARKVCHWALREMLKAFEQGTATRLYAAMILDRFEDGEFDDPVFEAQRKALVGRALARLTGWPFSERGRA
ncbi:MAG: hypothetical protein WAK01_08980 [Methylocystis sp.]